MSHFGTEKYGFETTTIDPSYFEDYAEVSAFTGLCDKQDKRRIIASVKNSLREFYNDVDFKELSLVIGSGKKKRKT